MKDGGVRSGEERQLAKIEAQKQIFQDRVNKLKQKKSDIEKEISESTESLQETKDMKSEAISRLNKIEESSKENQDDINKLEELIVMNERLREQEIQFKEQCRNELEELQNRIE